MSTTTETRGAGGGLLALSGVAFVILALVAVVGVGGDTPDNEASAQKVLSFYNDHQDRQIIAAFILAASTPFLAIFGACLALAAWPAHSGRRRVWPILLAGGAILTAGSFVLGAFVHFALADAADKAAASTLQGLNVLDSDTWMVWNSSLGLMMLGAAGSLMLYSRAYRVMAWIALVAGLALFIPFADFAAILVTAIWIIVASIMLYRREPAVAELPQPH
jgi:hypothetical protein